MKKITTICEQQYSVEAYAIGWEYANTLMARKAGRVMEYTKKERRYQVHHTKAGSVVVRQVK